MPELSFGRFKQERGYSPAIHTTPVCACADGGFYGVLLRMKREGGEERGRNYMMASHGCPVFEPRQQGQIPPGIPRALPRTP